MKHSLGAALWGLEQVVRSALTTASANPAMQPQTLCAGVLAACVGRGGVPLGAAPQAPAAAVSAGWRQKRSFTPQKVSLCGAPPVLLPLAPPCWDLIYLFRAVSQISLLGDSGINSISSRLVKQDVIFPRSQP